MKTYNPAPTSVAHRVCSYFLTQPEEELSTADVALKFECSKDSVPMLLRPAYEAGLLTRRGGIYGRGANLGAWQQRMQERERKIASSNSNVRATKQPPAHLPDLDMETLPPVEKGVPLPDSRQSARRGRTKYDALFLSLAEIGSSRLVPAHYVDAIKKAVAQRRKFHGEAYVLMRVDPQMARIWRVEPKPRKGAAQAANEAAERRAA